MVKSFVKKNSGIEYYESGTGQPILFIHGVGSTFESFQYQFRKISGRLIAINLPGYGNSDNLEIYSFDSIYEVLRNFIENLGLTNLSILGHSLGGMLAIDYVCRDISNIRKICLIGTTPYFGGRSKEFEDEFLRVRLEPIKSGMPMSQLAKISAKKLTGPGVSDEVLRKIEKQIGSVKPETWEVSLRSLIGFNRKEELKLISKPCLLIAGEHDNNAPVGTMEKMHKSISHSTFLKVKNVGHMVQMEAPEIVNDVLEGFFWGPKNG